MDVVELLKWAVACEASGDEAGAITAYLQADEQGDAEGSVLLGQALRRRGETELARAAFERGEVRGHREAAMCLGNLLSDLGEKAGARSAYERSIAAGSAIAVLNLGLMLADHGEVEDALRYLRMARDNGDIEAFWAIGKLLEGKRDLDGAAESYRAGAEAGDARAAYGLGVVLYDLGDQVGSRAAFQRARELGHDGAGQILDAFAREESGEGDVASGSSGQDVGRLWASISALITELGAQRYQLGRQWIADQLVYQEKQAKVSAFTAAWDERHAQFMKVCNEFDAGRDLDKGQLLAGLIPPLAPHEWITQNGGPSGSWALATAQARAFDVDIQDARKALAEARGKRFAGGLRQAGAVALGRFAKRLDVLEQLREQAKSEVHEAEKARDRKAVEAGAAAAQALESPRVCAIASIGALPSVLQPWTSDKWQSWTLDEATLGLRVGFGGVLTPTDDPRLGRNASFGTEIRVPWAIPLHESWFVSFDAASRPASHGFIRSLMLRQLASVAPGELQFCVFDPVGLGQSAGDLLDLAEYDADLIGGKVWTSPQDLEARLTELSAHIELVIQKYLRTTYSTIDEFNDAAGEVAEPYRMLVLFDFPTGLTVDAAARLKSIAENGPRCGVFTVVAADSSVQPPYGVDPSQIAASMRRLNLQASFPEDVNGYQLEMAFEHDVLPERSDVARRVIDAIGRATISRTETAVTFEKTFELYGSVAARGLKPELGEAAVTTKAGDPNTWWKDDSTRGLFAPIGQKGAKEVAILGFDSGDHYGALLVGRPGSGKSTLLHTYIGGLTTLYGPDELELYLIDFKEGVEFKAYAEEGLPHAKVIAIESDREFGLSILESLQAEISQRAQLLRSTGGRQAGMQALREATGDKVPRILLAFDEFQVLFSRNDKVGLAAADLLESIIRQGRGFGVHVLLGSQSLAGLDALGAHVPQLLPIRVLLPATEADARKVLGDGNRAGDYLTTHGEGILNPAGGAVEANERFKGALLPEADRVARLQVLRDKADAAGFSRRPMVFEGNSLTSLDTQDPRLFREELTTSAAYPIRIRSGVPMTVGGIGDIVLSREAGANVLAIVRSGDSDKVGIDVAGGPAYGLLAAGVASGAMTDSVVDVIDFMSVDDGLDGLLEPLLDAGRITLRRRRAFADVLESYVAEVSDRIDQDDVRRKAHLLFLFGVHRARELDSEVGSLDVDADLVEKLEQVMRDGPEMGVHVWLWSESVAGASRRLTPRMMRDVGWRVAGKMSADDSYTFIGSNQASDLRESQLILANDDRGISTRASAYSPPSREWMAAVVHTSRTESKEN